MKIIKLHKCLIDSTKEVFVNVDKITYFDAVEPKEKTGSYLALDNRALIVTETCEEILDKINMVEACDMLATRLGTSI